ncbi:hypothetical protein RCH11_000620 [Glaciihabitans sp. GrIS 2.15]|nr:hypothetical protein [Glaciihabitans sp. GrIS 2.15]
MPASLRRPLDSHGALPGSVAASAVARRSSLVAGAYSARSPTVRFFFRELATELAII